MKSAYSQLDLEGISGAPMEVFAGLLRPYIAEQLDVRIADICEQDGLDTEGIY